MREKERAWVLESGMKKLWRKAWIAWKKFIGFVWTRGKELSFLVLLKFEVDLSLNWNG
jgi:hypothetical protein